MAACTPILPMIDPGWTGVEIGVRHGESSEAFLRHGVAFLHMIDPWHDYENYPEKADPGGIGITLQRLTDAGFARGGVRFGMYAMMSDDAAIKIPDVDFVFIDGNHLYGYVKRDLELYFPKARRLVCGHDYCNVDYDENYKTATCGVKRAVDEYAAANGLAVEQVQDCWVIRK